MAEVGKFLLSPVAAIVGMFDKPAPPKVPLSAPPQANRASVVNEALFSRRGTRDNRRSTGPAEAGGGVKSQLGA